ncbi:MAG: hypothetical protein ACNA7W_17760, partial [Pseudomonadales bacterium]
GIYGPNELTRLTGKPPFAVVAYIDNSDDIRKRVALRRRALAAVAVSMVLGITYFHLFIKPVDVAWFMFANRLGI